MQSHKNWHQYGSLHAHVGERIRVDFHCLARFQPNQGRTALTEIWICQQLCFSASAKHSCKLVFKVAILWNQDEMELRCSQYSVCWVPWTPQQLKKIRICDLSFVCCMLVFCPPFPSAKAPSTTEAETSSKAFSRRLGQVRWKENPRDSAYSARSEF